jgi:hypothetical protein
MRIFVPVLLMMLSIAQVDSVYAGERVSLEDQLRILEQGKVPEKLIPGAEYRVAVFTFDDADGTGLNDAFAALAAREILTGSSVYSIGVIFFEGGLSPSRDSSLSYFDKVDRVTEAQDATLAVWGMIRETSDGVQVDTYLQVPASQLERYFTWRVSLPESMGGAELVARLRPDRVLVRRQLFSGEGLAQVDAAATEIGRVREQPTDGAQVVGTLPMNEVYYLTDREGDWVRLSARSGIDGWAPTEGHCLGECEPFLDTASFAGQILRYMVDGTVPQPDASLSAEAQAVAQQLRILDSVNSTDRDEVESALANAQSQQEHDVVPPGGAAFANLEALAALTIELKRAFTRIANDEFGIDANAPMPDDQRQAIYDSIELEPDFVAFVANSLARASQYDPRNTDVLANLGALFDYLGDEDRAALAVRLAAQYGR